MESHSNLSLPPRCLWLFTSILFTTLSMEICSDVLSRDLLSPGWDLPSPGWVKRGERVNIKSSYGHLTRPLPCNTLFLLHRPCQVRDKVNRDLCPTGSRENGFHSTPVTPCFGFRPQNVDTTFTSWTSILRQVEFIERTRSPLLERDLGSETNRERQIDIHCLNQVHWNTLTR